ESHASTLQMLMASKERDSSFFKLKYREAKQFVAKVTENSLDDLAYRYHLPPGTLDSIDVFAVSVLKLFKLIKARHIFVLKTSLSQALLVNILFGIELSKRYNKVNQLISVAKFIGKKYNVDLRHNKFVADLTEQMFNQLKQALGLREDDALYAILAAYLHNIGIFINNRSSHKHAEYIINSLSLFRLTDEEIKIIACIARYHRKSAPHRTHFLYNSLPADAQILVQKLSAILRITNALDSSHKQKIKKLEVFAEPGQDIRLVVHTQDDFILEKSSFMAKKELFEEISGSQIRLIVQHQE
ncbi:MAG: HD domain-containing protein, partial [Candidatus Moranbacteria bacterium]|nr:HD domain-containing protein [Candidatus Moranbacteria bacterium]